MTLADANLPGMVGSHPAMREVYRLVRRAAPTELPVVIVGETGTGKELVARALHTLSDYREGPFVDLNCAAVPESLAEAELFGWERGAFTGAVHQTVGLLETADGGTLFLDEVCSLPHALQAKLLRAIERQDFRRLGGRQPRAARFRVVAAASTPPEELLQRGVLRDDFAFRLAGVTVRLPPLRERPSDIEPLAAHFLEAANGNGRPPKALEPEAVALLRGYAWPGNVRELKTLMERLEALVDALALSRAHVVAELADPLAGLDESEWLAAALEGHGWNVTETARAVGLSRGALYKRLSRLGLRRPDADQAGVFTETR